MATTKTGIVEVFWKESSDFTAESPCFQINRLISTEETERVVYRTVDETFGKDIQVLEGVLERCHHVFVQITLSRGDFGEYVEKLAARARTHRNASCAVWRRRTAFVAAGQARLGKVCLGPT